MRNVANSASAASSWEMPPKVIQASSDEATDSAENVNGVRSLGDGGPRDIWAEMCTAETEEAEKAATEKANKEARQAWCDAFEEEVLQGKGRGNLKEGRSQAEVPTEEAAPPKAEGAEHQPVHLPPEKEWDLAMVQDLLDLAEDGVKVTWPDGLDPIAARKLLQGSSQNRCKAI